MQELKCTICGAVMYGNKNRLYCDECRKEKDREWKAKRYNPSTTLTCPICGREFVRLKGRGKRNIYCSPDCAREANLAAQKNAYKARRLMAEVNRKPAAKQAEAPKPKRTKKLVSLAEAERISRKHNLSYGQAVAQGLVYG